MEYYYAQINEDNICFAVSQLSGEMSQPDLIRLETFDLSLLGKIWNGAEWLSPAEES